MPRELHPDAREFLDRDTPDPDSITAIRERAERRDAPSGDPEIDVATVENRTIPGPDGDIPVRLYRPEPTEKRRPVVLYFHGGAWISGSLDTADAPCRKLARSTGYVVVSVDYRLAPEHPFPAWFEDCYAAFEWTAANARSVGGDPERIALVGPSAGGTNAAAVSLAADHRNGPEPAYQALLYPVTGEPRGTPSFEKYAEGYGLSTQSGDWVREHLLSNPADEANLYFRPRYAHDLSGLPPTLVLTAGFDPVRDDGKLFADRLEDASVPVTYREYDDVIHGFLSRIVEPHVFERAHEAYDDIAADLRDALE